MYKLVVLSALLAVAFAAPSGILAPTVYSSVVGHLPTTISHQSSSVVHSAAIATPLVAAAPIVTAHAAPIITAHAAPLITAHAAPIVSAHAAPLLW